MVGLYRRCVIYGYDYIITVANSQSIMPWLHPIYNTLHVIAMMLQPATCNDMMMSFFCLFHVFEGERNACCYTVGLLKM